MNIGHVFWLSVIEVIKRDAEAGDYSVDFLAKEEYQYIYFRDDDQAAVYLLDSAARNEVVEALRQIPKDVADPQQECADVFWGLLNEKFRITE